MEFNIGVGMTYEVERTVTHDATADFLMSGQALVFATPIMIMMMEQAAILAVYDRLGDGFATVGTVVNVEHCAPTPVGMRVWAKAVLKEIDGRRLVFDVTARNETEIIGRGTHERFIIEQQKFIDKANLKFGGKFYV